VSREKRALALLLGHAVLVQVISYALRPAISYAILDLGYDSAWLGVATAAFAVPPLLLAIPAGHMADRLGERTSLVIGSTAYVLAALFAIFAGNTLWGLLVATVLVGLGVLYSVVGQQAWVMRGASAGRLDSAFGLYTFATSSGQMAGPLLLLLPSPVGSHSPPFATIALVALGVALACLVLSLVIRSVPRQASVRFHQSERMLPGALLLVRQPGVLQALIASSLVLSSLDILLAYLPLLAQERHLAASWITVMLVGRGAATMVSRIALGWWTRRFGRRRVLVGGSLIAALSLASLVLPLHPIALVAAMVLYGFAAGTVQPLTMSWITLVTLVHQRGVAASLRLVGNRAGQTLIPLVVAGLSTIGGAALVFGFTGLSLLAAAWTARAAPTDDVVAGDTGPST
jgi:MFS family permease